MKLSNKPPLSLDIKNQENYRPPEVEKRVQIKKAMWLTTSKHERNKWEKRSPLFRFRRGK